MNSKSRLYGAAAAAAIVATTASPALAAGTTQGTQIQNTVNVAYQVGGVNQTAVSGSDTFVVDRKVNLAVSELGGAATTVAPNQQDAVTTFSLTNSSNDTLDFGLVAANETGAGKFGGTDAFDVSNFEIYRESNGTAGLQTGTGGDLLLNAASPHLDEVAADATVVVYVVADVPAGVANAGKSVVSLTAQALAGGGANVRGAALTNDTTVANTAGTVQNVFADAAANDDAAYNGQARDKDDYLVAAAAVTATKTSTVISDVLTAAGVSGAVAKAIPGATLQYCIAVSNASGSAAATNVTLTDNLPALTTYVAGSLLLGLTCADAGTAKTDAADTDEAQRNGAVVSATIPSLPGGETRTLRFRVTIN